MPITITPGTMKLALTDDTGACTEIMCPFKKTAMDCVNEDEGYVMFTGDCGRSFKVYVGSTKYSGIDTSSVESITVALAALEASACVTPVQLTPDPVDEPQIETHGYAVFCVQRPDGSQDYYLAYGVYDEDTQIEIGNYKPIGGAPAITDADLASIELCKEVVPEDKDGLEPFYGELTAATAATFIPSVAADTVNISISQADACDYVRVELLCPGGAVGCMVLGPNQPSKAVQLNKYAEVVAISVTPVAPDATQSPKNWAPKVPESPIIINIDSLNLV